MSLAMTPTPQPTRSVSGQPDGDLQIKSGGQVYSSWTEVNVTCRVIGMPNSFSIGATPKVPGDNRPLIPLNSPTQILIGGHVVLTGYSERATVRLSETEHTVALIGRGRCCDLVDCSAIIEGTMSISNVSPGDLARQLVAPFAGPITVLTPDGDGAGKDYTFAINLSESPYEILQRVCRYEGLIPYENAAGNLVLARAGTLTHASGFAEGDNCQSIEVMNSLDERFSIYIPQIMSADTMGQIGAGGNAAGTPVKDPGVNRYRPKIVLSEQMVNGAFLAEQRAQFEANLRAGESFRIDLVCDSWLDSAGLPWTPNYLAPFSMPSLGLNIPDLVITQVSYRRDGENGTTAHVTLMDKLALSIEPQALQGISVRFIPTAPTQGTGPLGTAVPTVAPLSAANAGPNFNPRAGEGSGL